MVQFNVIELAAVQIVKAALQLRAVDEAGARCVVLVEDLGNRCLVARAHLALFSVDITSLS